MTFPGGTISLPTTLLNPGKSGSKQVHAPEQPMDLSRMPDAALMRLAENLAQAMDDFAVKPGGLVPALSDYFELLQLQVSQEIMRRCF